MTLRHIHIFWEVCQQGNSITRAAHSLYMTQPAVSQAIRELEDLPFPNPYGEECPIRDLGTLGGGNHFAEFQCVERIYDKDAAGGLGLAANPLRLQGIRPGYPVAFL